MGQRIQSVIVSFLMASLARSEALAQQVSIREGHRIAMDLCVRCHRIGPNARDVRRYPPDFAAVADTPTTSPLALRVFLQTPHGDMPRYQLSDQEIAAIGDYILSLRRR
jgi:mono/diheme cytochrome c family protein